MYFCLFGEDVFMFAIFQKANFQKFNLQTYKEYGRCDYQDILAFI